MNKKGFTLIELLGVVIILSVVITLVTPKIIEEIKDSNEKTDEYTKKYIITLKDLDIVKRVFVEKLINLYHARVPYPEDIKKDGQA